MKFDNTNPEISFFNENKGNIYLRKVLRYNQCYQYRLIGYSENKTKKNDIYFILRSSIIGDGVNGSTMKWLLNNTGYDTDNLNLSNDRLYTRIRPDNFFNFFIKY